MLLDSHARIGFIGSDLMGHDIAKSIASKGLRWHC